MTDKKNRGKFPPVDGLVPPRVNKEIKRRTNVVGIFPNEAGVLRLAGSVLLDLRDRQRCGNTKEVGPRTNELLAG